MCDNIFFGFSQNLPLCHILMISSKTFGEVFNSFQKFCEEVVVNAQMKLSFTNYVVHMENIQTLVFCMDRMKFLR